MKGYIVCVYKSINDQNVLKEYALKAKIAVEKFKGNFFLDLKLNDISTTAKAAINSIKDLKRCRYITINSNGGLETVSNTHLTLPTKA